MGQTRQSPWRTLERYGGTSDVCSRNGRLYSVIHLESLYWMPCPNANASHSLQETWRTSQRRTWILWQLSTLVRESYTQPFIWVSDRRRRVICGLVFGLGVFRFRSGRCIRLGRVLMVPSDLDSSYHIVFQKKDSFFGVSSSIQDHCFGLLSIRQMTYP